MLKEPNPEVTQKPLKPPKNRGCRKQKVLLDEEEQRRLHNALIGQNDDAVFFVEVALDHLPSSCILSVNAAYTLLMGQTIEENPPFFLAEINADLLAQGQTVDQYLTLRGQDRKNRHLRLILTPLGNARDARLRCIAVLQDRTGQHLAERELQGLRRTARCVVWHAVVERTDGLFRWHIQFRNEVEALKWLAIKSMPGKSFADAWHEAKLPEDRQRIQQTSREALRSGASDYQQEFRARLADGKICWLAEHVQIEPEGPNRWSLVGVCTDVTDRRQMEDELRDVIARAHCLIWHADVTDYEGSLNWDIHFPGYETALEWLPIFRLPDVPFHYSWSYARLPEDNVHTCATADTALRSGQSGYSQEFRIKLENGEVRHLFENVQIACIEPGKWRLTGVCTDISERKYAQEELRSIITSARCLVWHAHVTYDGTGLQWHILMSDEEAAQRWLPVHVSPGQTYSDAWHLAKPAEVRLRIDAFSKSAIFSGQTQYSQEFPCLLADGQERWLSEDVQIESLGPNQWRLIGICTDVTERRLLETERERMLAEALDRADRDPLTGLLNHRAFHALLDVEADRALRQGSSLGVAVIDLDNFKFFNDAYGHLVGDDVLRRVADALRRCCRSYDILARYGGDEFAVLMPGTGIEDAQRMAERLTSSLENVSYAPPDSKVTIPLNLSVGVAVFPDDAPSRLEALTLADTRLRTAKSGGTEGDQAERLRTRLLHSVEGFAMLNALVAAVDNKDRYTRRHSEDVLTYCLQIAQELGLDEALQHQIQIAALLHDVGKIGVPDHILRKPGGLTAEEYEAVQQHPMMGAIIVGAVPGFEATLDAIRHHHERWDGQGYPFGLYRDETPLMARIMAVADAYSAMTTDRPYRKGMQEEQALAVLAADAGIQWDPASVQAFLVARQYHLHPSFIDK